MWGLEPKGSQEMAVYEPRPSFRWPLAKENTVVSPFGMRKDAEPEKHDGIDIRAAKGTPVYASAEGKVDTADLEWLNSGKHNSYLIINSPYGYQQRYVHLDSFTVKQGDTVTQGDLIGYSGTRKAVDPHLHFEIRKDGKAIDPTTVLPPQNNICEGSEK